MQFHFKGNEGKKGITRSLPGHDLYRLGSSFEFLVKPFNDIGGFQRDPFFHREMEAQMKTKATGLLRYEIVSAVPFQFLSVLSTRDTISRARS